MKLVAKCPYTNWYFFPTLPAGFKTKWPAHGRRNFMRFASKVISPNCLTSRGEGAIALGSMRGQCQRTPFQLFRLMYHSKEIPPSDNASNANIKSFKSNTIICKIPDVEITRINHDETSLTADVLEMIAGMCQYGSAFSGKSTPLALASFLRP